MHVRTRELWLASYDSDVMVITLAAGLGVSRLKVIRNAIILQLRKHQDLTMLKTQAEIVKEDAVSQAGRGDLEILVLCDSAAAPAFGDPSSTGWIQLGEGAWLQQMPTTPRRLRLTGRWVGL